MNHYRIYRTEDIPTVKTDWAFVTMRIDTDGTLHCIGTGASPETIARIPITASWAQRERMSRETGVLGTYVRAGTMTEATRGGRRAGRAGPGRNGALIGVMFGCPRI